MFCAVLIAWLTLCRGVKTGGMLLAWMLIPMISMFFLQFVLHSRIDLRFVFGLYANMIVREFWLLIMIC